MAPPLGPPPYTQEQISAMTSDEEKLRARAELSSYIARMKREKQEREAQETHYSNGYSPGGNNFIAGGHLRSTSGFRGGYRAQYAPRGRGRGYRQYHPYQRVQTQHGAHNFQNNSATFNQTVSPHESRKDNKSSVNTSHASFDTHSKQSKQAQAGSKTLCPALTSTGICSRPGCAHIHDADKQALCKQWLYKGDCPKGDFCLLSHTPSPNNSPTCLHFQSGRCSKEDCRFAHIHLNLGALNCDAFGRLGYCEKGEQCAEFHAHECPAFSNNGNCPTGDKCSLRHVHRASRLRSAARRSPVSDSPSTEDVKEEGDHSDNIRDVITAGREAETQNSHSISQQADFVPFGPED